MLKCAKYGGSSLANQEQIDKVYSLLKNVNVFSAPGTDNNNSIKITSALINYAKTGNYEIGKSIIDRFQGLEHSLGVNVNITSKLEHDLNLSFPTDNHKIAYLASRGERYLVELLYNYYKKKGENVLLVLPEEYNIQMEGPLINSSYSKNFPRRDELLSFVNKGMKLIIPGFYGVNSMGEISILSRGGGDVSGSFFSNLFDASIYEIWSDKDGIYQVDPRIIPISKVIGLLNYDEARILGSFGTTIIHPESIEPCELKKIPILIKNTNNPGAKGTKIVSVRLPQEGVIGIAKQSGLAYISMYKSSMAKEKGFTANALKILADASVNTHHYPTGLQHLDIFVEEEDLIHAGVDNVVNQIEKELLPNQIDANNDISFLTLVGIGMMTKPGIIGRAGSALGNENINIEVVSKCSNQPSVSFGVKNHDANKGLEVLYGEFFK